ncbi:hypothetical protein JTB14_014592 [Gonioctena quinquepunctata]|nr:hypothetical protein JTB14_014592 [Gonioctena quinquepunctata]
MQLFGALMPKHVLEVNPLDREMAAHFERLASRFSSILSMRPDIMKSLPQSEVCLWKKTWEYVAEADEKNIPSHAVRNLLQILATLPISIASAERSFQTLRKLKTCP